MYLVIHFRSVWSIFWSFQYLSVLNMTEFLFLPRAYGPAKRVVLGPQITKKNVEARLQLVFHFIDGKWWKCHWNVCWIFPSVSKVSKMISAHSIHSMWHSMCWTQVVLCHVVPCAEAGKSAIMNAILDCQDLGHRKNGTRRGKTRD